MDELELRTRLGFIETAICAIAAGTRTADVIAEQLQQICDEVEARTGQVVPEEAKSLLTALKHAAEVIRSGAQS
jgi:polyhydroxyalkanoate synthesis regulator phasin